MEPKTYLNRYRIITGQSGLPIRVIGGAGERTYKAEDVTSQEPVALELVPAGGLHPDVLTQLEAEAQSAKQLNHINIPKLYDFGVEDDHLVYASELFDGTTAEAWVTAHGPMAVGATLRIAQQVVGALGAATFHGILHHAINPRNIMIVPGQTTDGEWPLIKVLNFVGIAPDVSTTDAGALGAAYFASPEQLATGDVDFRSEIYSLGKTLSFLLTGAAPLGNQSIETATGVAASVKQLIVQMTATDPANRPLDPLAFQRHIQDLLAQVDRRDNVANKFGLPPAAAKPVVRNPQPTAFPTRPLVIAALVLALVTFAALGIAALRPGGLFAGGDEPIGVPVGVPDATTQTATTQTATTQTPPNVAQTQTAPAPEATAPNTPPANVATSEPSNAVASNPPVLTSDPEPSTPAEGAAPATDNVTTGAAQQAPQVAANNSETAAPSSEPTTTAPATERPISRQQARTVASNKQSARSSAPVEEPLPPSEGPDRAQPQPPASADDNANSYAQAPATTDSSTTARANSSSTSTATPKTEREKSAPARVAAASTPRPKKPATVASSSKRTKKSQQFADNSDSMPAIPRGAVRAEFLGTTADGNLVFGLPSEERGYVEPGESRRRRSRRGNPPPDMEVLPALPPVLPALPPDEDEE